MSSAGPTARPRSCAVDQSQAGVKPHSVVDYGSVAALMMAREELAGLVRLRTFLEHALKLAEDRSEPGRHSALVALDGVCEYALFLSGHHVGIQVKERAGFVEMLNALEQKLASWRRDGRRSVLQMRGARNQAQHAGALPDADHMPDWADAAEAFVRSLVEAAFDVSLSDVLLAEAILNDTLRAQIAAAEQALAQTEPRAAFESAVAALSEARRRWRDQQSDAYDYMPTSAPFSDDPRWLEASQRGEDYADIGVFASDLGEYHRLIATRRQVAEGVPVTEDDARRTLLFAYDWILRWQRFDAQYPRDRWREHWQTLRPLTAGDGTTPSIVGIDVKGAMQLGESQRNHLVVRVSNVPEQGRGTWGTEIDGVLANVLARHHLESLSIQAGIQQLWIGELTFFLDPVLTSEVAASLLKETVEQLTEGYESRRIEAGERDAQAQAVADRFGKIFADIAPELLGGVRAQRELHRDGELVILLVDFNGSLEELHQVASIFNSRGGQLANASVRDASLVFNAFVPEGDALQKLTDALDASITQVAHVRDFAARREAERVALEDGLARVLDLRTNTQGGSV